MNIYNISLRYLLPKNKLNLINVLSIVSFIGIITSIMALIIILSAFNGMSDMIKSSYKRLQPDLLIKKQQGQLFILNNNDKNKLDKLKDQLSYYEILESKALLSYSKISSVSTVKGVTEDYLSQVNLKEYLTDGTILLEDEAGIHYAILSESISQYLNVNIDSITRLIAEAPKRNFNNNSFFSASAFSLRRVKPVATFTSGEDAKSNYIFVHRNFAKKLFEQKDSISSIEVFLKPNVNADKIKKQLRNIFTQQYLVQTSDDQNESIYKVLNTEKLTIYLILSFVMFIAICNMVGSLTMLIVSKRKDIAILSALGFPLSSIRSIFITSGSILVFLGSIVGLTLGLAICVLQQKFKLVMIASSGSFAMEPYPISIKLLDIFNVFLTALVLAIPALLLTSRLGTKNINICKDIKV